MDAIKVIVSFCDFTFDSLNIHGFMKLFSVPKLHPLTMNNYFRGHTASSLQKKNAFEHEITRKSLVKKFVHVHQHNKLAHHNSWFLLCCPFGHSAILVLFFHFPFICTVVITCVCCTYVQALCVQFMCTVHTTHAKTPFISVYKRNYRLY